ncbi:MAG: M20/M25/M40 family metallo-hydrolase [bacterium]|nr:M20/M25/M40 family metallo-hydrolase [bacterium]
MNTIEIANKLISIPSFVGKNSNEAQLAGWIFSYIKSFKIPVKKQYISEVRFNVIAGELNNPKLLVVGHMDTVPPKEGWKTDPFKPTDKEAKIFGLGASDMKGGLAVMLSLISKTAKDKIMYLFYIDEEYYFQGMKKFIKEYKGKIKPKIIASVDGDNKIGYGCRGLIEMIVKVKGKSGHSALPFSGINAVLSSVLLIKELTEWLAQFQSEELGLSTFNIAAISGGFIAGKNGQEYKLDQRANVIPDYCEFVVEIRPATNCLTGQKIKNFLSRQIKAKGIKIINIDTKIELGSWITDIRQIEKNLGKIPVKNLLDPGKRGYVDLQMLWETFGKVPCFTFGVGENGVAHKENEYVKIANIKRAENFYAKLFGL